MEQRNRTNVNFVQFNDKKHLLQCKFEHNDNKIEI